MDFDRMFGDIDRIIDRGFNFSYSNRDKKKQKSDYSNRSVLNMFNLPTAPDIENQITGRFGEDLTRLSARLGIDGYYKLLSNILLPIGDVKTEIDLVIIHEKGIFVVESKNYSGWIFGNKEQKYWTQSLPGGNKNKFYNPIKQNQTHCNAIEKHLGISENELVSFIVFSDRCELKVVPENTDHTIILQRILFSTYLNQRIKANPTFFSKEIVDSFYSMLERFIPTPEELEQHRNRIRNIDDK